ncbi:MAG: hypothetical protein D6682_07355 [Zetaproteobacteria bacterium]|nr:MAG: hypothetical protein D6682_07355 [Zetaproteobacteria bacterium]
MNAARASNRRRRGEGEGMTLACNIDKAGPADRPRPDTAGRLRRPRAAIAGATATESGVRRLLAEARGGAIRRMVLLPVLLWLLLPAPAGAVSLGRIEVASHLGERFFAEIPLKLDPGESLSTIFVDLASPIEYRFLEVYRDSAIDDLKTTVRQDRRGLRVEIASSKPLQSPYINLVLRLRHGRATHFKKYPVFLPLPESASPPPARKQPPKPEVSSPTPAAVATEAADSSGDTLTLKEAQGASPFKPFSGWARTGRYGPIVYGDTLMTVARRLRIDQRYTMAQVIIALFRKNRDKFSHDNINLIKAGSYLDTPTAAEVEAISRAEARAEMERQTRAWKELIKQERYARVAEAQKHRYSKRVRVGGRAEGHRISGGKPHAAAPAAPVMTPPAAGAAPSGPEATTAPPAPPQPTPQQPAAGARIARLVADNALLRATVKANNKRIAELERKLAAAGTTPPMTARIKRLEAEVLRLQRQRSQEQAQAEGQMQRMVWLLYGAAAFILLLLVAIAVLMRRQPQHPAQEPATMPPVEPARSAPTAAETARGVPTAATETPPRQEAQTEAEEQHAAEQAAEPEPSPPAEEEHAGSTGEEARPKPDDVDYLTEADVYLRYGMEEEAEQRVRKALELDPQNSTAHAKLVEIRRARGDDAGAEEAKRRALALLEGAALAEFTRLVGDAATSPTPAESAPAEAASPEERAPAEAADAPHAAMEPSAPAEREDAPSAPQPQPHTAEEQTAEGPGAAPSPPSATDEDALLSSLLGSAEAAPTGDVEEEEEILDLSGAAGGTTEEDLEALLSSLEGGAEGPTPEEAEPGDDAGGEHTVQEEASTGELSFDLSGIDLSRARVEESRIDTEPSPDAGDLEFDATGLDLSGITLPGAAAAAAATPEEATPSEEAPAEVAAQTTAHPETDGGIDGPSTAESQEDTPAADDGATAESQEDTPAADDGATAERQEEESVPPASGTEGAGDPLEISLEMDDLDALLAEEAPSSAPPQGDRPDATAAEEGRKRNEKGSAPSMDDELGALLDGLDELDFDGGTGK